MKPEVDLKVLHLLKKHPEGLIIQNMIDKLDYHRFTIQKALYRLMIKDLITETIYTQNVKVYRYKLRR